jgi:hypothetical protein
MDYRYFISFDFLINCNAKSFYKISGLVKNRGIPLFKSLSLINFVYFLQLVSVLQDRMTECRYLKPLASFDLDVKPQPWFEVDVLGSGQKALAEVDKALGTHRSQMYTK